MLVGADFNLDLGSVLGIVRPSAMRSLDLQVASVHFDEIGGQGSVKQRLREAVEWPLKYPERMRRLGVSPPKVRIEWEESGEGIIN
jgi:AAA family ATPase